MKMQTKAAIFEASELNWNTLLSLLEVVFLILAIDIEQLD